MNSEKSEYESRADLNNYHEPEYRLGSSLKWPERLDAATAAFQVGYESPSHFSREYSRLFGAPPLRDITKLRQMSHANEAFEFEAAR